MSVAADPSPLAHAEWVDQLDRALTAKFGGPAAAAAPPQRQAAMVIEESEPPATSPPTSQSTLIRQMSARLMELLVEQKPSDLETKDCTDSDSPFPVASRVVTLSQLTSMGLASDAFPHGLRSDARCHWLADLRTAVAQQARSPAAGAAQPSSLKRKDMSPMPPSTFQPSRLLLVGRCVCRPADDFVYLEDNTGCVPVVGLNADPDKLGRLLFLESWQLLRCHELPPEERCGRVFLEADFARATVLPDILPIPVLSARHFSPLPLQSLSQAKLESRRQRQKTLRHTGGKVQPVHCAGCVLDKSTIRGTSKLWYFLVRVAPIDNVKEGAVRKRQRTEAPIEAPAADQSQHVWLLFSGARSLKWWHFIELGRSYLFTNLIVGKLFEGTSLEMQVLQSTELDAAEARQLRGSYADVFGDCTRETCVFTEMSTTAPPSLTQTQSTQDPMPAARASDVDMSDEKEPGDRQLEVTAAGMVSYEGEVTRQLGACYLQIDHRFQLNLVHYTSWAVRFGVGLRVGAKVLLRNVHVVRKANLPDTFACCVASQVQLTALSPFSRPGVPLLASPASFLRQYSLCASTLLLEAWIALKRKFGPEITQAQMMEGFMYAPIDQPEAKTKYPAVFQQLTDGIFAADKSPVDPRFFCDHRGCPEGRPLLKGLPSMPSLSSILHRPEIVAARAQVLSSIADGDVRTWRYEVIDLRDVDQESPPLLVGKLGGSPLGTLVLLEQGSRPIDVVATGVDTSAFGALVAISRWRIVLEQYMRILKPAIQSNAERQDPDALDGSMSDVSLTAFIVRKSPFFTRLAAPQPEQKQGLLNSLIRRMSAAIGRASSPTPVAAPPQPSGPTDTVLHVAARVGNSTTVEECEVAIPGAFRHLFAVLVAGTTVYIQGAHELPSSGSRNRKFALRPSANIFGASTFPPDFQRWRPPIVTVREIVSAAWKSTEALNFQALVLHKELRSDRESQQFYLRTRDLEAPQTIDIYLPASSVVPIGGLIPGAVVTFFRVQRKVSQSNTIYLAANELSDLRVDRFEDVSTIVQERGSYSSLPVSHFCDVVDYQHRAPDQAVRLFRATVVFVVNVYFRCNCKTCGQPPSRCKRSCSAPSYHTTVSCMFAADDHTAEARVVVDGDIAWEVFGLSESEREFVEELVKEAGEVDFPPKPAASDNAESKSGHRCAELYEKLRAIQKNTQLLIYGKLFLKKNQLSRLHKPDPLKPFAGCTDMTVQVSGANYDTLSVIRAEQIMRVDARSEAQKLLRALLREVHAA